MFKKFSPPFFSENRVDKKEQDSSEVRTSWRKTVSPVPSFLLKADEKTIKGKKEGLLKSDVVGASSQQSSKKASFEKNTESPQFGLSHQEKKIFGKPSLYNSQNVQERYVFTMTKFSFWTVLGSLLILGILFFLGGFGLALYLVTSSPALIAKIDNKLSWQGKPLEASKSSLLPDDKSAPAPSSASSVPGQASPPTSSPNSAVSPQGPPSSTPESTVSLSEKGVAPAPSPLTLPTTVSALKMSPLLAQKNPSQGGAQEFSPYSLEYGTFITREEALKRADRLIQKGYHPIIVRIKDSLHIFSFSVRCGNYLTRDVAVKDLQIADKEFGPIIVRNGSESKVVYP